jgi:hypothetical protein
MKRPQHLEDAGFDMYLDTRKLRDLPLPIEQKDIDELIWCFDFPVWERDRTDDWNLTPREVIEKKSYAMEHVKRVQEVNLAYPIIVVFHKNKWVILDGIHRLVKAYMMGLRKADVKIVTKESWYYRNALLQ